MGDSFIWPIKKPYLLHYVPAKINKTKRIFFFPKKYFNKKISYLKLSLSHFSQILIWFSPFLPFDIKGRPCVNWKIHFFFSWASPLPICPPNFLFKENNNLRDPT